MATLIFAPVSAAEVELAASGQTGSAGGLYVAGPQEDDFVGEWRPGQALGVNIVPTLSRAPSRVELGITRTFGPTGPMRIALQTAGAGGRPGAILASSIVDTGIFQLFPGLNQPARLTSIDLSGWPRLQAGTSYMLTAFTGAENVSTVWADAIETASVREGWYGRVEHGATEPDWRGRTHSIQYLRLFAARRPTRLTANALIVDRSPPQVFLRPSATLLALDPEEPLAGRTIAFFSGGRQICAAVTNGDGRAACTGPVPLAQSAIGQGFRASFAGDKDHEPAYDQGPLVD